jgi:hypothetical protein
MEVRCAGSHIETRALALLRKLQAVSEKSKAERPKPSRLSGRKRGASAMTERYNEDIADRSLPRSFSDSPYCKRRIASYALMPSPGISSTQPCDACKASSWVVQFVLYSLNLVHPEGREGGGWTRLHDYLILYTPTRSFEPTSSSGA